MAWWVLEVARVCVLLLGAILVQQLIRKHGVAYAEAAFRETPRAGQAFLSLADIAYYLIVAAYTLFTVNIEGLSGAATPGQFQDAAYSVGGLALILGGLHAFNILVLPGFGSSLARRTRPQPAQRAVKGQA